MASTRTGAHAGDAMSKCYRDAYEGRSPWTLALSRGAAAPALPVQENAYTEEVVEAEEEGAVEAHAARPPSPPPAPPPVKKKKKKRAHHPVASADPFRTPPDEVARDTRLAMAELPAGVDAAPGAGAGAADASSMGVDVVSKAARRSESPTLQRIRKRRKAECEDDALCVRPDLDARSVHCAVGAAIAATVSAAASAAVVAA